MTTFPDSFDLSSLDGSNGFILQGNDASFSGFSVSGAGDVNSDGIDDLIVGAPGEEKSYVVFGSSTRNRAKLKLPSSGRNGFVIRGADREKVGTAVSNAGDVNGDGIDDLIIGARDQGRQIEGGTRIVSGRDLIANGKSYVVFGNRQRSRGRLALNRLNSRQGFVINGTANSDLAGKSVSGAGDVNGDGIDDLIIGAPWAEGNGESYVVFGSRKKRNNGELDLADLNGRNGFAVSGINRYDSSGSSVSSAGDINGDGIDDLIIGAPNAERGNGESYVVFGSRRRNNGKLDLSDIDGRNGFVIKGSTGQSRGLGYSVSGAGDVNGDGFDDLIIGAPTGSRGRGFNGRSYVVFGRGSGSRRSLDLATLNGRNGFVINSDDVRGGFASGASVSGAGDINNDGFDDLIIGGSQPNPNAATKRDSYVVFGSGDRNSGQLNLSELNGSNGFVLNNTNSAKFVRAGFSVSGAGDVNGDGIDDLIVGLPTGSDTGRAGESYVVFGRQAAQESASIVGTQRSDTLLGTSEDDTIEGLGGNDTLNGKAGSDRINGGKGNDILLGALGDDALFGGDNNDTLKGGNGDDVLSGGLGKDLLTGGKGKDIFVFSALDFGDTITDFNSRQDKIEFGAGLHLGALSFVGNDVLIKRTSEVLVTLSGVDATALSEANFVATFM